MSRRISSLYRLPRITTCAIRRWNSVKLWFKSKNNRVRGQEQQLFRIPGVGTFTKGKDGVACYETAVDETNRLIKRAKRQHEKALKQSASAGTTGNGTGETKKRGI